MMTQKKKRNSDEDVVLEETNECKACGGEEYADDNSAWIGCQKCTRWFHKHCLDSSYSDLSLQEIKDLDFTFRTCQSPLALSIFFLVTTYR